jgi:putative ABC transport system ATP-binding protein
MRKVSESIGEAVAGALVVHAHGTSTYERADFSDRLGKVFGIRFQIYIRKGQVKFLNNFLNQMAPLMFYSLGGYLVIQGELTAGALAAALTAHKDMSAPWKELLDYYQQTADSKIKYEQVTEQFRPENMFEEALQMPVTETLWRCRRHDDRRAGPRSSARICRAGFVSVLGQRARQHSLWPAPAAGRAAAA